MQVGDRVYYDCGAGQSLWEIAWYDEYIVQLVDAQGGTIFVSHKDVQDLIILSL